MFFIHNVAIVHYDWFITCKIISIVWNHFQIDMVMICGNTLNSYYKSSNTGLTTLYLQILFVFL